MYVLELRTRYSHKFLKLSRRARKMGRHVKGPRFEQKGIDLLLPGWKSWLLVENIWTEDKWGV